MFTLASFIRQVLQLELAFFRFAMNCTDAILSWKSPGENRLLYIILIITRLVVLGLTLRTYVGPWMLAHSSKHIRVRSISLRSIRGLYVRRGTMSLHVDRVRFSLEGAKMHVRIDSVRLELDEERAPLPKLGDEQRRASSSLLYHFTPLPILWSVATFITHSLDPFLRPVIRSNVVASLRLLIHHLPSLTKALDVSVHSITLVVNKSSNTSISVSEVSIATSLDLVEAGLATLHEETLSTHATNQTQPSTVVSWRRRMAESFSRALDRAWGGTVLTASVNITCRCINGFSGAAGIFQLPGSLSATAACQFSPQTGTINERSMNLDLSVDDFSIVLDSLVPALQAYAKKTDPLKSPQFENDSPSPYSDPRRSAGRASFSTFRKRFSRTSRIFDAPSAKVQQIRDNEELAIREPPPTPWIYLLSKATVKLSVIRMSHSLSIDGSTSDIFSTVIHDIDLSVAPWNTNNSQLHTSFMGRYVEGSGISRDAYVCTLRLRGITLVRCEDFSEPLHILQIDSINLQALVSHWPSPLLCPPPSMSGDPNASLLAIELGIGRVDATENLDNLQRLVLRSRPLSPAKHGIAKPQALRGVPKVVFQATCGVICGSIICGRLHPNEKPLKTELRCDGLLLLALGDFPHVPYQKQYNNLPHNHIPLRFFIGITMAIQPIFVRVRSNWLSSPHTSSTKAQDPDFMNDPPVFSSEAIEMSVEGTLLGFLDEGTNLAQLDLRSTMIDLHCSSDAICVELWHADVASALKNICSSLSSPSALRSENRANLVTKLPSGLSACFGITRLVCFVTAPDLNPEDRLGINRGVALRTGVSLQYSFLKPIHANLFRNVPSQSETRHKLYLPQQRSVEAVSAARSSTVTKTSSAFLRVEMSGLKVRSAVSSQYEIDEPLIAENDDAAFQRQNFLEVGGVSADITISGNEEHSGHEYCDISLDVPNLVMTFQPAHVYSALLAIHSFRPLAPTRPVATPQRSGSRAQNRIHLRVRGMLKTVQLWAKLQHQSVLCRLDAVRVSCSPNSITKIGWNSLVCWVTASPNSNWQDIEVHWEELLRLQGWEISSSSPTIQPSPINIQGDSARMRIPFDFIVADLIQDLVISAKAMRHIHRLVLEGYYRPMDLPESEEAKVTPVVSLKVNRLCLEAADDDLENQLGMIWRAGFEATKQRQDREEAFFAKVATVEAEGYAQASSSKHDANYQFSSQHSVSVEDARERLDRLHTVDWHIRHQHALKFQSDAESKVSAMLNGDFITRVSHRTPNLFPVNAVKPKPPLLRAIFTGFSLHLSPPPFSVQQLKDFMFQYGKGLPRDTSFSLLVPMHIHFSLSSLAITIRDYPLPLASVPSSSGDRVALTFDSYVVIGEEMGSPRSVDWISCDILDFNHGIGGSAKWSLQVPKTIMPVKTYAHSIIDISTENVVSVCWGGSYAPAIQDIMRVLDTVTSPPRDSSPILGFWDKLRLVFHGDIKANFKSDVRLYLKGSRDPYRIEGDGAGFVLSWQGHPRLLIGYHNDDKELIQVTSNSMLIAIPDLQTIAEQGPTRYRSRASHDFQKICFKLSSGVKFGIGFAFERACGDACPTCKGGPFHRLCRLFEFQPHYEIMLEVKDCVPIARSSEDSYSKFRSDFVHLSISLSSSMREESRQFSSIHLSPTTFAHFWSWWSLFDHELTLPIRQGSYYPTRIVSPKLGRHLATIKYRFSLPQIFLFHAYMDDSRDTWIDGVTPFVGAKAKIGKIVADLHQREQEVTVTTIGRSTKTFRKKAFYIAEVVMKDLDLRAVLASFPDPLKKRVPVAATGQSTYSYRCHLEGNPVDPSSSWVDLDDFVEPHWSPTSLPQMALLPVVFCPRFTYFKRNTSKSDSHSEKTKFGSEDTHTCLLGREPSVSEIQVSLAVIRIEELERELANRSNDCISGDDPAEHASIKRKIALLQTYISHMKHSARASVIAPDHFSYCMPSDVSCPNDWIEFDNVYQIHQPRVFMDTAVRDVMLQYYHCSRARRGFEYHLATRAIKFIRDQAKAVNAAESEVHKSKDKFRTAASAVVASQLLRKLVPGEKTPTHFSDDHNSTDPDPLNGWSNSDIFLSKSHFCLLLKPQIVLRSEDSVCIVAAVTARLQAYAIIDRNNADDPVSGKIMSRNYTTVTGLQTFSPSKPDYAGDGCVPLEVLVDLRCESSDFDRIVPQTDATIRYDKFNRLRLRNNVTSVARPSIEKSEVFHNDHLQNQTDLVRIHIPQFTTIANDDNFQSISRIVSDLLLFSDAAHKTRLDKLKTMLFTYDFADFELSANVVSNLQARLRGAIETARLVHFYRLPRSEEAQVEYLKLEAHIFLLAEELTLLFDAIKLAQETFDDRTDQKSALLLHASSSEISWRMLDSRKDTLAKLAVRDINYYWLNKQDSSMVNTLSVGDLQAFDGAPDAIWPEILCKHREPVNHPLLKRGIFILATWIVLAPVGGITIYEEFDLHLHPMRLQIDARVGTKILEYVWPARKQRKLLTEQAVYSEEPADTEYESMSSHASTTLLGFQGIEQEPGVLQAPSAVRKLRPSRSFTNLRSTASESLQVPKMKRTKSISSLRGEAVDDSSDRRLTKSNSTVQRKAGDAAEMKTRSSQKSFVHARIASLHLLLSIMKEESFDCRDARIRTRVLEYRNQTWSFEELVNQFIPSDTSWKGWVKMAFQQPLIPVLPVAKELWSKTSLVQKKKGSKAVAPEIPPSTLSGRGQEDMQSSTFRSHSQGGSRRSEEQRDEQRHEKFSLFTVATKSRSRTRKSMDAQPSASFNSKSSSTNTRHSFDHSNI